MVSKPSPARGVDPDPLPLRSTCGADHMRWLHVVVPVTLSRRAMVQAGHPAQPGALRSLLQRRDETDQDQKRDQEKS